MNTQNIENRERVTIVSPRDLEVSYFCGSGVGGTNRNKVATGVQIKHSESGAIGRASDSRSQEQNKKSAFERLLADPRMKFFIAKEIYRVRQGEYLEQTVERETGLENLKFEIQKNGKWMEVPIDYFESPDARMEVANLR